MLVTLYSRPNCPLCDDARDWLEHLRPRVGFAIEEVDITADPDLHARYRDRIPVVAVEGKTVAAAPITYGGLAKALLALAQGASRAGPGGPA